MWWLSFSLFTPIKNISKSKKITDARKRKHENKLSLTLVLTLVTLLIEALIDGCAARDVETILRVDFLIARAVIAHLTPAMRGGQDAFHVNAFVLFLCALCVASPQSIAAGHKVLRCVRVRQCWTFSACSSKLALLVLQRRRVVLWLHKL